MELKNAIDNLSREEHQAGHLYEFSEELKTLIDFARKALETEGVLEKRKVTMQNGNEEQDILNNGYNQCHDEFLPIVAKLQARIEKLEKENVDLLENVGKYKFRAETYSRQLRVKDEECERLARLGKHGYIYNRACEILGHSKYSSKHVISIALQKIYDQKEIIARLKYDIVSVLSFVQGKVDNEKIANYIEKYMVKRLEGGREC